MSWKTYALTILALLLALSGLAVLSGCGDATGTDTVPPADVQNLSAIAGDGQAILTWTDPGDADLAWIEISFPQSNASVLVVQKGVGTAAMTGLANGASYTFTVKAVDTSQNKSSGVSREATPASTADVTPPGDVTALVATVGDGAVTLSWNDPSDADLTLVEVSSAQLPGSSLGIEADVQTAKVAGLANGTDYTFTVRTVDAAGNVSAGVSQSATPASSADATAPAEVANLAAAAGDGLVTLSWTDPADADFSHVEAAYAGQVGVRSLAEKGVQTIVLRGLVNGTSYTFTVKTVDSAGNKSAGTSTDSTPVSGADVTAPADVTGLAATAGEGSVTLIWNDPADADFDHVAVSSPQISGMSMVVGAGVGTMILPGLPNYTAFTFTVRTVDATGNKSVGVSAGATPHPSGDVTPPAEVSGLSAAAGNGQVRLSWTDPGDTDLSYMRITHTQTGGAVPFSAQKGTQAAVLEGLTNGVSTTFTVQTVDAVGNMSAGVSVGATPSTSVDPVAPGPVTGLTAMTGNRVVLLSWADPGDSDLAHVRVQYMAGTMQVRLIAAKGAGNARITDLINGTAYTFRLFAVDASGNLSAERSIAATPTTTGDMSAPGDVGGILAVPLDRGVLLTWVDPADADLNHVEITHDGTGGSVPVFVGAGAQTARILGLTNGVPYTFTVRTSDASLNVSTGVSIQTTPTNANGTVVVGITLDVPLNTPILFGGTATELLKQNNDAMDVLASESDASSYAWYLDDALLPASSNTVRIESGGMAPGQHSVTLVIVKDGRMHSGRFTFLVLN